MSAAYTHANRRDVSRRNAEHRHCRECGRNAAMSRPYREGPPGARTRVWRECRYCGAVRYVKGYDGSTKGLET